jgi:tRNA-splicing endonuclease subunit Sen34
MATEAAFTPTLPISISMIGSRYLLFDVNTLTWLRREHHICGVALGTLPVAPAQNLFLGVPIEIMPEEAQLLVERGVGVIVDDARAHDRAIPVAERRKAYLNGLAEHAGQIKKARDIEKAEAHRIGMEKRAKRSGSDTTTRREPKIADFLDDDELGADQGANVNDNQQQLPDQAAISDTYAITPATSQHLLPVDSPGTTSTTTVKDLPSTYPLYRLLHDKNYFMTPGLRFGCQYTVYPGDPLRFHSHFLAIGSQWDEEIDLMDIVGGGRLGTGVKKGFLIGGEDPRGEVRTFSVEWAAM